jgi:glycosyltransferase involved in cell wall biosynthesis
MIIGFDATALAGNKTGIGIYAVELISALLKISADDAFKLFSCQTLGSGSSDQSFFSNEPFIKVFPSPNIPPNLMYFLWYCLKFPSIESMIGQVDIFHGLSNVMPPTKKARTVLTIHDLAFMRIPDAHTRLRVTLTPKFVRKSIAKADAILAVSEHTKKDIVELFGVDPEKITVSYNGVDHHRFLPIRDPSIIKKVCQRYGILRPYIYYLGTIEPRKNVNVLLKAFSQVNDRMGGCFQLVLSGKMGWKVDDLTKEIANMAARGNLIYTGYISDEDKAVLYNGAELFVYPSRYEGFGIPVVEAMACGCPVITTNVSSLPEVAGAAGMLVEPNNTEALADAMIKVLDSEDLRRRMAEASLIQAAGFTWQRTAEVTKRVYSKLL